MKETMTFGEFAAALGCAPGYVTQLKRDGRLVLTDDGRMIRAAESHARITETADPSKAGVAARHSGDRGQPLASSATAVDDDSTAAGEGDEGPSASTPSYQTARAKREHYAALAAERDYDLSMGRLIDAEQAAAAVRTVVVALRARLEGLAPTLAAQIAGLRDERQIQAVVAQEIEHALEEATRALHAVAAPVSA